MINQAAAAPTEPDLDLEACAREPIRIPGSVQPHGAPVVLRAEVRLGSEPQGVARSVDAPLPGSGDAR